MRYRNPVFVAIFALFQTGCASIMSGSHQAVSFNSIPDGATITVDGQQLGQTPLAVKLSRKRNQILEATKEGYKKFTVPLTTGFNVAVLGDLICSGPFGTSTDASTGALYEYQPNQYNIVLVGEKQSTLEVHSQMSDKDKAKNFILMSYQPLKEELNRGGGANVLSLMTLLHVPEDQKTDAVARMNKMVDVYPDPAQFADAVIALYMK
jgi:PEGA domain-containing protein